MCVCRVITLIIEHSRDHHSLSFNGRKRVAESVYNMPVSVPSSVTLTRPLYGPRMNSNGSYSSAHHFLPHPLLHLLPPPI